MNIINENNEKIKRYLPHELQTRINAVKTYRNGNSISFVCRKYHISRTSLYRWNKVYDETRESLMDKSHKPISKYPNAHTDEEIKWIKDLIRRNPNITLCEIWYKLRLNKGYSRHIGSLYRVMKKLGYYKQININGTSKYIPKKYNTPKQIGIKWQIDVKFVPVVCQSEKIPCDKRFYQYTCIDEASRERFLFWYDEHTSANTVDFVKRCIAYYESKRHWYNFFGKELKFIFAVNIKEYSDENLELIIKKFENTIVDYVGNFTKDDYVEFTLITCMERSNKKFIKYINDDIIQRSTRIILPVGIVFNENTMYIPTQKTNLFKKRYERLKMNIIDIFYQK